MLVSMTGFGSASLEDSNLSINIELKSFNSRYFELNTKSFDLSGPLEHKIRKYLKKQLFRGSISLIVKVDSKDSFKFNEHKTSSVLKAYREIEKKFGVKLNYSQLLKNNDILTISDVADLSIDELLDYIELSNETAGKVIMMARESWSEEE